MIEYLNAHPEDVSVKRFRKKNTLISGPSGSGKTYCVEVLGDLLQIPTLIVDATDYTEAGYVGKSADDMIRELIELAPGGSRPEQAKFISKYGGLIFIDEIDKKAKDGTAVGHDISREGFQRSVLKLIERKAVTIHNPLSPAAQFEEMVSRGKKSGQLENMVSTENILFILGGSFERRQDNLESIVKQRLKHRGRLQDDGSIEIKGFSSGETESDRAKLSNYYKAAEADDYIRFGLLPEMVGRSPIRTYVNLLSKNDLVRIMRDTEDSILHQYALEFKLFGITIEFAPDAVEYVAGVAENRKTGARALVSVWENILTDFQFELPGSSFTCLTVNRALCKDPNDALLKMLERSPFADFVENFEREYGIKLILDEEVQGFIEAHARLNRIQVSEILKKLFFRASALNYMGTKKAFQITNEMIEDEKYFDKLFASWYEGQKKNQKTRS
jgi:endopeptidase Clp ATP-binding regulatory subunit ClpX